MFDPRRPPTTESVSRISSTLAVERVAAMTPTSPSLFSTVMSLRMPEEVPALIVTVREKDCIGPIPTIAATTSA